MFLKLQLLRCILHSIKLDKHVVQTPISSWSDIGRSLTNVRSDLPPLSTPAMSDELNDELSYVIEEGSGDDKRTIILQEAFISPKNVTQFRFSFDNPQDITESLKKNQTSSTTFVSTHQGRTGYAPATCTYPNGTTSNNMVMTHVVVQYVKTMAKDTARYGKGFFFVGIPKVYIDQISKDAKASSGRTVLPKEGVQEKSGYYWMSCNSDRLGPDDVTITVLSKDQPHQVHVPLRDTLIDIKQHLLCNATVSVTASITTKTTLESLDLKNGRFSFSIKLIAVDLLKEIDVDVPELTTAERRTKETREDSELNVASSAMAKLAISRLGQ